MGDNIRNRGTVICLIIFVMIASLVTGRTNAQSATTRFAITIRIHGIGTGGDNVSSPGSGTVNPLHAQHPITVTVYDASNTLVATKTGNVSYNASIGQFQGVIDMGALQNGVYTALVKTDQTLRRSFPGIISVSAGQTITLPIVTLITGDVNNDNVLSIADYAMILDCFSDLSAARNCSDNLKKTATDITDDGSVNQFDYNLFLRCYRDWETS